MPTSSDVYGFGVFFAKGVVVLWIESDRKSHKVGAAGYG